MEQDITRQARAFVLAHGVADVRLSTWVPPGQEVHFYTEVDEDVDLALLPGILAAGDVPPRQVYRGGEPLPNYLLAPYAEDDIRDMGSTVSSRLRHDDVLFVGVAPLTLSDGSVFLCTSASCTAAGHVPDCRGLFSRVRHREVHLLVCRGDGSGASPLGSALAVAGSEQIDARRFAKDLEALRKAIMSMARDDPFMALEQFCAQPVSVQVSLRGDVTVAVWQALMSRPVHARSSETDLRWAVARAREVGDEFLPWLLIRLPDRMRAVLAGRMMPAESAAFVPQVPSRVRPTFVACWSLEPYQQAFVEWLSLGEDRRRGLALVRLYRAVRHLLDRLSSGRPRDPAVWLGREVLHELDAVLAEGGYRFTGLGADLHEVTSDLIRFLDAGPSGKQPRPPEKPAPWPPEAQAVFAEYVGKHLRALEAYLVSVLEEIYAAYRAQHSPASA